MVVHVYNASNQEVKAELRPQFSVAQEVLACWGTHMLGYSHVGALTCTDGEERTAKEAKGVKGAKEASSEED